MLFVFLFVGSKKTDDSKVFITEMTDDKSIETVHLSNKVKLFKNCSDLEMQAVLILNQKQNPNSAYSL